MEPVSEVDRQSDEEPARSRSLAREEAIRQLGQATFLMSLHDRRTQQWVRRSERSFDREHIGGID